jgi:hypothetical protein
MVTWAAGSHAGGGLNIKGMLTWPNYSAPLAQGYGRIMHRHPVQHNSRLPPTPPLDAATAIGSMIGKPNVRSRAPSPVGSINRSYRPSVKKQRMKLTTHMRQMSQPSMQHRFLNQH